MAAYVTRDNGSGYFEAVDTYGRGCIVEAASDYVSMNVAGLCRFPLLKSEAAALGRALINAAARIEQRKEVK